MRRLHSGLRACRGVLNQVPTLASARSDEALQSSAPECWGYKYSEVGQTYVVGSQNYGPFLGPLNTRCRIILRAQKRTTVLTTIYVVQAQQCCLSTWSLLCKQESPRGVPKNHRLTQTPSGSKKQINLRFQNVHHGSTRAQT